MKNFLTLLFLFTLFGVAQADITIVNTLNDEMTYEVTLPNGDTKKGTIKPYSGYYPSNNSIPAKDDQQTTFKVFNEAGDLVGEETSPNVRLFVIFEDASGMKMQRVSWYKNNGQKHKRVITLLNATGQDQTFDVIDEKEVRNMSMKAGEIITFPAKNGKSGSSGFHDVRFPNGTRRDKSIAAGYFCIMYNDKRDTKGPSLDDYGHVTPPRGASD